MVVAQIGHCHRAERRLAEQIPEPRALIATADLSVAFS
jgi:hypothetical protein